jgi:hypothetical protein
VKFLYRPLTGWKLKSLNKLEPLQTSCLCTVAFATTAAVSFFSSMRNTCKCTKLLLAAKTSLGLP